MDADALQTAVFTAINVSAVTDALGTTNIFSGRAPTGTTGDYITFGEQPSSDQSTHDSAGGNVFFRIRVWVKGESWEVANLVRKEVESILRAGLTVADFDVMTWEPETFYIPDDPEGLRQLVMDFRIQMLEAL